MAEEKSEEGMRELIAALKELVIEVKKLEESISDGLEDVAFKLKLIGM